MTGIPVPQDVGQISVSGEKVNVTSVQQNRLSVVIDKNAPTGPRDLTLGDVTIPRAFIVFKIECTEWLVTHDPEFERRCQHGIYKKRYKQAELMDNMAVFALECPGAEADQYRAELWDLGGPNRKICEGYRYGHEEGRALFLFRTTVGSGTGGAKTDEDGGIYVEGEPLVEGPEGHWTDYYIRAYKGEEHLHDFNIRVGPLMRAVSFAPDIMASEPESVDPYGDEVDVKMDVEWWPWAEYEAGFGLEIHYKLVDEVADLSFEFSDAPEGGGDMGGTHRLLVHENYMKPPSWYEPHQELQVKWEGFDAAITDEEAHRIYMWDEEAERVVGSQTRGISPVNTAAEGEYLLDVGMKLKGDESQRQAFQVQFEVDYGVDFESGGGQ